MLRAARDLHLPVTLEHRHLAAQLQRRDEKRGEGNVDTSLKAGQAQAHLIDVTLAAGMHGLTDGTLAPQFLDVPQKTLDGLVL